MPEKMCIRDRRTPMPTLVLNDSDDQLYTLPEMQKAEDVYKRQVLVYEAIKSNCLTDIEIKAMYGISINVNLILVNTFWIHYYNNHYNCADSQCNCT